MSRSLGFRLSLGLSALVALAILTVIVVLLGARLPRLYADVEADNRAFGKAAAAQINGFLTDASSQLDRLAVDIGTQPTLAAAQLRTLLYVFERDAAARLLRSG